MGSQSIYQPIKWWQIRVLKLHSGEDNELLQGDLRVANVIEAESGVALHAENEYVEYEALSYCWGDPELTTDIMINAIPSKITTSLGKALERLRYPEQCRWIWCDALCIHQSDDEEKSQQVQKILSIFSRASRVIIWLGDAGPHTAAAIRCMNEGFCDLLGMGLADFTEDVWDGLCDLYSRPWIFRIWGTSSKHSLFSIKPDSYSSGEQYAFSVLTVSSAARDIRSQGYACLLWLRLRGFRIV